MCISDRYRGQPVGMGFGQVLVYPLAEDLPGKVETDTRYEKLSTDRSDCRLSFAYEGLSQSVAAGRGDGCRRVEYGNFILVLY